MASPSDMDLCRLRAEAGALLGISADDRKKPAK